MIDINEVVNLLDSVTNRWIENVPDDTESISINDKSKSEHFIDIITLILKLHYSNFILWDTESKIREPDNEEKCYQLKSKIDNFNLQRNLFMEKIDDFFFNFFDLQSIKQIENYYINSETLGQMLDRISILTLKSIFRKISGRDNKEIEQIILQREFIMTCFSRYYEKLENKTAYMINFKQFKLYKGSDLIKEN